MPTAKIDTPGVTIDISGLDLREVLAGDFSALDEALRRLREHLDVDDDYNVSGFSNFV